MLCRLCMALGVADGLPSVLNERHLRAVRMAFEFVDEADGRSCRRLRVESEKLPLLPLKGFRFEAAETRAGVLQQPVAILSARAAVTSTTVTSSTTTSSSSSFSTSGRKPSKKNRVSAESRRSTGRRS